jgi:hypothetical protein
MSLLNLLSLFLEFTNPLPFIIARRNVEQLIVLCCSVGFHGNIVFSSLLPGNDSFAAIRCNENLISESLLSNGRLALTPLFRLSAVTSQYLLQNCDNATPMWFRLNTDRARNYSLDSRGSNPGRGNTFLFSTVSRLLLGPIHSPIQWPLRVKLSQREADDILLYSAEVENGGSLHSLPLTSSWHSA